MSTAGVTSRSRTRTPKYCRQREKSGPDRAYVNLNGKRIHLGGWGTDESRQEYDRRIAEWLANSRMLPTTAPPDVLTIKEVVANFWLWAESYYRTPDGKPSSELECYRWQPEYHLAHGLDGRRAPRAAA